MLVRIAVLASLLLPLLVGFVCLRKGGRSLLGALAGAAHLFFIAIGCFLLLAMAARGAALPFEAAAMVLPFFLAHVLWLQIREHL